MLRAPFVTDEEFLFRTRNDFTTQNLLLAIPRANSIQRVRNWIEGVLDDAQSVFFIVAQAENNQPIGFVQLRKMNFVHGNGELGIFIDSTAHGKGVGIETMRLLESYVRGKFNLRKITLEVLADNHRAVRFYEKLNFQKIGVLQKHFYYENEFHDVLIMEKFLIGKDKQR